MGGVDVCEEEDDDDEKGGEEEEGAYRQVQGVRTAALKKGVNKVRRAVTRTTANHKARLKPSRRHTHTSIHPSVRSSPPHTLSFSPRIHPLDSLNLRVMNALQSKWSCCSVNTGLICRGARLGYINLNLAAVPQRSATARRMEERGDSRDGWTERERAMIQSVVEIYHSMASLPSSSESNSFITGTKLCFFFFMGKCQRRRVYLNGGVMNEH